MKATISEEIMNLSKDNLKDLKCSFEMSEEFENMVLIKLSGRINSYNSIYFQEKMDKLIDTGCTKFVFNMADLDYVSAVGIGSFIHIYEKVKKIGGNIVLNNIQNQVLEVFQLPGFSEFFSTDKETKSAFLGSESRG